MRKTKILTLSLPENFFKKIKKILKEENLTQSEFFREALRMYLKEKEKWRLIREWGKLSAKKFKIKTEEDIERMIDEIRK